MVSQATLVIALWAVVFSAVSFYINNTFGGRQKVKELQKEVNDFQKKFEAAARNKDEVELAKLKILEPGVMGKMQEMLFLPLKGMIIILPVFFVFLWVMHQYYPTFLITLPFAIHPSEILSLKVLHSSVYGARGFFLVVSIAVNLILLPLETRLLGLIGNGNKQNATNKTLPLSK